LIPVAVSLNRQFSGAESWPRSKVDEAVADQTPHGLSDLMRAAVEPLLDRGAQIGVAEPCVGARSVSTSSRTWARTVGTSVFPVATCLFVSFGEIMKRP